MKVRSSEVRWWVRLYLKLRRRNTFTISGTKVQVCEQYDGSVRP